MDTLFRFVYIIFIRSNQELSLFRKRKLSEK